MTAKLEELKRTERMSSGAVGPSRARGTGDAERRDSGAQRRAPPGTAPPTLIGNLPRAGAAEVIVVANGCVDGRSRAVTSWRPVPRSPPLNPAAARNAGVEVARGRWLAFLDADTDPGEAWFDAIRDLSDRHGDGGNRQIAGWPVLAPAESGWVARAWQRVRFSPGRLPDTLDCANLVMTRALFDRLGGFNAGRIAGEDVEICEHAVAAGETLLFDERLAV